MARLAWAVSSLLLVLAASAGRPAARVTELPPRAAVPRRRLPPEGEIVFMAPLKPALGPAGYEIVTMNLDGSGRRQITDDDRQEFLPHFSPPDGKRLLYTRFVRGVYGSPDAVTHLVVYDFATGRETDLGAGYQGVWSPDGARIAYLSGWSAGTQELVTMDADGTRRRTVGAPGGGETDTLWGDPAWSTDGWIVFCVAEVSPGCFKVRLDRIREDGSGRARVGDGGPNCTPPGMEQSGDADPGLSADGRVVYTSRGFPNPPAGEPAPATERRLVALSSDAWFPGKTERDLSLPAFPSAVEGVPKGSPDGRRILLYRRCTVQGMAGIALTDTDGSFRRLLADGFGPDWHPLASSHAADEASARWRARSALEAALAPVVPPDAALDAHALAEVDGDALRLPSGAGDGAAVAAFDATWTLPERPGALVAFRIELRASLASPGPGDSTLAVLAENPATGAFEKLLYRAPAPDVPADLEVEVGDLGYAGNGRIRLRVLAAKTSPFVLAVDRLRLDVLARD